MSKHNSCPNNGTAKPTAYIRQADILASALISDSPEVMGIARLAPAIQTQIITARLMGYHPVSVRWPTGQFALMFCETGETMPRPQKILEAYYQCRRTVKLFPEGELT